MGTAPKFSIIIPAYCRPDRLKGCLQSLACLDYPKAEFEVLIVDDGSEPPLSAAAIPLPAGIEVRFLRSPRNEGPGSALNRGAAEARGACLVFLDDDCRPRPDWLLQLQKSFERNPESVIGARILDGLPLNPYSAASTAILGSVYRHYNAEPGRATFLAGGNIAMPASLFERSGGFHPAFRTSQDREFCGRCLRSGIRLVYAPDVVVIHDQPIGFRGFWRRHFGYGRGSCRVWRVAASTGERSLKPQPAGFYWRLLCSPFADHPFPRALLLTALVVVSQIAGTFGALFEWSQSRGHVPPRQAYDRS